MITLAKSTPRKNVLKKIFFLFICIFFSNCTLYIPEEVKSGRFAYVVNQPGPISCEDKTNLALYSDSYGANKVFAKFILENPSNNSLDEVDFFILWSLFQMNIRPDLTSLGAHTLLVMNHQGSNFQILSDLKLTLHEMILELIKRYHPKKSVAYYASILNNQLPKSIPIGEALAEFIDSNQDFLKSTPYLHGFFFRAEEAIVSGESVPRLDFLKYTKAWPSSPPRKFKDEETFIINQNKPNTKCNFLAEDFNQHTINDLKTNSFLLRINKSFFFATTTQNPKLEKELVNIPFTPNENSSLLPFCVEFKNDFQNIISSLSGKAAHQLLAREIIKDSDFTRPESVKEWFGVQRTLKINAPERFITESHKSREVTDDYLEYSKYPVYHAHQIGQLVLMNDFNKKNNFWIDGRNHANLYCKGQ
jgi:hypothetical protein